MSDFKWVAQDKNGLVYVYGLKHVPDTELSPDDKPTADVERGQWWTGISDDSNLFNMFLVKGKPNENWEDSLINLETDNFSVTNGILEKITRETAVYLQYPLNETGTLLQHPLFPVLMAAIHQAAFGKGERHGGNTTPFLEQPWVGLADRHGRGFLTGQCEKKVGEAANKDPVAFRTEILGAINYAGMSLIYEEQLKDRSAK